MNDLVMELSHLARADQRIAQAHDLIAQATKRHGSHPANVRKRPLTSGCFWPTAALRTSQLRSCRPGRPLRVRRDQLGTLLRRPNHGTMCPRSDRNGHTISLEHIK